MSIVHAPINDMSAHPLLIEQLPCSLEGEENEPDQPADSTTRMDFERTMEASASCSVQRQKVHSRPPIWYTLPATRRIANGHLTKRCQIGYNRHRMDKSLTISAPSMQR